MKPLPLLVLITFVYPFVGGASNHDLEVNESRRPQRYIDTVGERWAFNEQMVSRLKPLSEKIQDNAKKFAFKRELGRAEIPDSVVPVYFQEKNASLETDMVLRDGIIVGLQDIGISLDKDLVYDDVEVLMTGFVNFTNGLKITHSFMLLRNATDLGFGETVTKVEKMQFDFKSRLNLVTGRMKLEDIERSCHSPIKVDFKGSGQLNVPAVGIVISGVRKHISESVFDDVEKLTRATIEGALDKMEDVALPEYDYFKNYVNFNYNSSKKRPNVTICPENIKNADPKRAKIWKSGVEFNSPENLPFIQNHAEMWSFEEQIRDGVNKYLNDVMRQVVTTLYNRGLGTAKLPDVELYFATQNGSQSGSIGNLKITDGWIMGAFDLARHGSDFFYFDATQVEISAKMHFCEDLKINQSYQLTLDDYQGEGSLFGRTESMTYMAKILVNLETFETTVLDLYLVCIGDVQFQVAVIETKESSYEYGIVKVAQDNVNATISKEIGKWIRHALEYTVARIAVKNYLPPWDYKRVNVREGNVEPKYRMCQKEDIDTAQSKVNGTWHRAVVKANPVHFINTELERKAFGEKLLTSMNTYLREMLHEASNIITIQDLKKIKFRSYIRPWSSKDPSGMYKFGMISIYNGILEDLSNIFEGQELIDTLEYDDKYITLKTRIPLWWNLKFQGNASVIHSSKNANTLLHGQLSTLVYYLKIKAEYLGSKTVTVEDFRVDCLGDGKFWTKFHYNDNWLRASVMEHFSGFLGRRIWPEANQILKRALQEAIAKNDITKFLPSKNYRDRSDDPLSQRMVVMNKITSCKDVKSRQPDLNTDYTKAKLDGILPLIKSETLRANFEGQIKARHPAYLNRLWNATRGMISEEYVFVQPPSKEIYLKAQGPEGEDGGILRLKDGWFRIFPSSTNSNLIVRNMVAGGNDSIIVLSTEEILKFKVVHNFTLDISGMQLNGTLHLSARGLTNTVVTRFFVKENRMTIVDYNLFCAEDTRGFVAFNTKNHDEYKYLEAIISEEAINSSMTPIYKDFLIEMMDAFDMAVERDKDSDFLLPEFIRNKHLYDVAIHIGSDPKKQLTKIDDAIKCQAEEKTDISEHIKKPSFIGTTAEWTFFNKEIKSKMEHLKRDVDYFANNYLFINDLKVLKLADKFGKAAFENHREVIVPQEIHASKGSMTYSFDIISPTKVYFDNRTMEMILEADINSSTVFHYDFNVTSIGSTEKGWLDGTVDEIKYTFRIHVHLGKQHFKLESIRLNCIRGINMEVKGLSGDYPEIETWITKAATDELMNSALNDLEGVFNIALLKKVMLLNEFNTGNMYLVEWNYDKDYSDNPNHGDRRDFNLCPVKMNFYLGPGGFVYFSE